MKLASVFIPALGEVGLRRASVSKSPLPASTGNGSTCPAGWRLCWGGKDSYAQPKATGRDSCRSCSICSERSQAIPSISMLMAPIGTKAKQSNSFFSAIPGFISSTSLLTSQLSMSRNAFGAKADMKLPAMSGSIALTPRISDSKVRWIIGREPESSNYAS